MVYYIFYYLIGCFISFLHDFGGSIFLKKMLLLVFFFVLVFFPGLRSYDVGTDTSNYMYIIDNIEYIENIEFVFSSIIKIINFFFNEPYRYFLFFLIISMMINYFLYKIISVFKFSLGIFFIFLVNQTNFMFDQFNTIRQLLALTILYYSLFCLFEKKYYKFLLLSIFAFFTHSSAGLVALIFFFLWFFKERILYATILVGFLYLIFIVFFGEYIYMFGKYSVYSEVNKEADLLYIGYNNFIFMAGFTLVAFFLRNKISISNIVKYNFFIAIMFLGLFFQICNAYFNFGGYLTIRLTYYFLFSIVLIYGFFYEIFNERSKIIFWIFIFLTLSLKFIILINSGALSEYSFLVYE